MSLEGIKLQGGSGLRVFPKISTHVWAEKAREVRVSIKGARSVEGPLWVELRRLCKCVSGCAALGGAYLSFCTSEP